MKKILSITILAAIVFSACTKKFEKTESGIDDNPDQEGLDVFARLIVEECAELFPMQFTDEQYQRRIDKTIKNN